jgi:hypothetical protein
MRKSIALSTASIVAISLLSPPALANSTIDPTQPPMNGAFVSAPVRNNFVAAFNDINNLLNDFASPNPPPSPSAGQRWRNTGVTPNVVNQWSGTAWLQISTFDITGGTITPFFGNRLLAWQQLIPGLGASGECMVFTGTSTNPTPQSCTNTSNFIATAPIDVSFAGAVATASISLDSNFAVSGGNLALAPITAGDLIANCGGSAAEPTLCSWNSFANQAIGSANGVFPLRFSGAWQVGSFDATHSISGGVVSLNLGNPNIWSGQQTFVAPVLGAASGTSLTLGGASIGSNALAVLGTISFPNNSLTLAEFPTIGANTVLGSIAGGTPIALSQAQLTSLINPATTSLPGALPAWPNNTTTYFRGDATYATLNFAAIGGVATGAQLPTPGASSLGAVFSKSCASGGQFVQTINTDGTVNCVTPSGGGNVSNSGTPVANQIAQWTGSTTIQGVNLASLLTAGNGVTITGTTNATISANVANVVNLLPNTQWQVFDSLPVMTKMNFQGTGTQAQISVTSYSASGVYNTFNTSNTQQLKNGDLVAVSANSDPVLTRSPWHVQNLVTNTSFGGLSPFQGAVGATSSATITPLTAGDVSGTTTQGPTGWTKTSTMILWRDDFASNAQPGSHYTLGMRKGANTTESLTFTAAYGDVPQYQGRNVVCGGWVLSKLNAGNGQWKFGIHDGTQNVFSATNAGAYTWAEVTATISTVATSFSFDLEEIGTSGDGYYLSQPICAYGTFLGAGNYVQNPGEHIDFRNHPGLVNLVPLTQTFPSSTFSFGSYTSTVYGWELNIEAVTQGAIAGTVKAVDMQVEFVSPTAGKQVFTTPCIGIGGILIFGSELNTPSVSTTIASNSRMAIDGGSCLDVTTQIGGAIPEPGYFAIWSGTAGMTYTNLTYDFYGATLR